MLSKSDYYSHLDVPGGHLVRPRGPFRSAKRSRGSSFNKPGRSLCTAGRSFHD